MKNLLKSVFLLYICVHMVVNGRVAFVLECILLLLVASSIFRAKFHDWDLLILAEAILTVIGAAYDPRFAFIFAALIYDLIYKRYYIPGILAVAAGVYFLKGGGYMEFLLLSTACALYGYSAAIHQSREVAFTSSYDRERQYRYELEQVKAKLMNSSKEIAHITEMRERNRIARGIHDSVGHSITGILFQLQAAFKLLDRDPGKSKAIMQKCIDGLSQSVTTLRDTVHNIKPREELGIEYIRNIIDNFSFCKVELKHSGDFNSIPPNHLEIIGTNMKEALTNAARYSKATHVDIAISVNDVFTRLYIKDNGVGCKNIKEGLGLSGMKERVHNAGGNISLSSDDGFMIVCVIPVGNEGGSVLEDSDSR